MNNKNIKFLIFLFLFSFFIRLIFFIYFVKNSSVAWQFDSKVYTQVAQSFLNFGGFLNSDGTCHFYRVPGYSIFLALFSFGLNLKFAIWLQIVLASFIPMLIFFLTQNLFPDKVKLPYFVSVFSSVHLGFVLFSGLVLTESIFLILFLIFLIFFYKQIFFLSGFFLGLASMFRPVGHYVIFVSIFIILLVYKNKLKNTIILFTSWLIVVLPWLLRNFLLTGCLFFTTLPGIHFLKHSAARICMDLNNISYSLALNRVSQEWSKLIDCEEKKAKQKLNPAQICNLAEKVSLNYFFKDFFITGKHVFRNLFKTCFSLYSAELLFLDSGGKLPEYSNKNSLMLSIKRYIFPKVNKKVIILFIYLEMLIFLFLLTGFFGFIFKAFIQRKYFNLLIKVLPFIFLFVFISLSCGFARLRLPIEPFVILLSFEFWLRIFKRRRVWL